MWGLVVPMAGVIAMMMWWSVVSAQTTDGDPDPVRHSTWFFLVGGLAALTLGYRQTSRERNIDAWAFALHRPVGGAGIVGAKLVVGIGSIIGMMLVPYALAMLYLSVPGVRAVPFDRAYWMPGVADVFAAMMLYACGMFIGIRMTSRVASRVIGAVIGMGGYIAIRFMPSFGLAIAVATAIIIVMIAAAWSDYMSGSVFDAKPWWGRVASVSAAVPAVAAVVTLAMGSMGSVLPKADEPPALAPNPTRLFVNAAGMIDTVTARDTMVGLGVLTTDTIPTTERATASPNKLGYREPRRWVTRLFPATHGVGWYYERREGLISVYDEKTRSLTGYLRPDGFTKGASKPAKRFAGYLQDDGPPSRPDRGPLVLSGGVYMLNELGKPTQILEPKDDETVLVSTGGALFGGMVPGKNMQWGWFRAVVTTKRIYLLDHETGAEQLSVEHPAADAGRTVRVYRAHYGAGSPTYIWYSPRRVTPGDTLHHVLEFRIGSAKPAAEYHLGGVMYSSVMNPIEPRTARVDVPLTAVPGLTLVLRAYAERTGTWVGEDKEYARALLLSVVICLVASAVAFWMCRRYAFSRSRTIAWTALAGLIGPVVLVVMWLLLEPAASSARVGGLATATGSL